jgi:hypothetical protein
MTPEKEHAEKHSVAPLLKATYKVHSKEMRKKCSTIGQGRGNKLVKFHVSATVLILYTRKRQKLK